MTEDTHGTSKQNNNKIEIDEEKLIGLLGSNTRFVPARTDNVHIHLKKNDKPAAYEAASSALYRGNNKQYQNAKIPVSSAPDGYCWIVIDYDDHKGKGNEVIPDFKSLFGLPDTFTVKTPTGVGKQEWYLIDEDVVNKTPDLRYIIPKYSSVEIFIGHKNLNHLFVAPGSIKKNGQYTLQKDIPPKKISTKFFDTLVAQANTNRDNSIEEINKNIISFNSDEDASTNKQQFISYLNNVAMKFEMDPLNHPPLANGDGRNSFIYKLMLHGFTFNLSKTIVKDLIESKIVHNSKIILDTENEFSSDNLDITLNSAYNNILDAKRANERAITVDLMPFEEDENGFVTIHREQYIDIVKFLSIRSISKIMNDPKLRRLFCQVIIFSDNNYWVPQILGKDEYKALCIDELENAKSGRNIRIEAIFKAKFDLKLHWEVYDNRKFKEKYLYRDLGKLKNILQSSEFDYINHCRTSDYQGNLDIIVNKGAFYPILEGPCNLIKSDEITEKEHKDIDTLIDNHMKYIVDKDDFQRERDFILDRYALMLQRPNERTESVLIFKGPQGSGKSGLVSLLMSMFSPDQKDFVFDVDDFLSKFYIPKLATHIDEADLSENKKLDDRIKGITTASYIPKEYKFKDRMLSLGAVNLSIATNNLITNIEYYKGRRNTIIESNVLIDQNKVEKQFIYTLTLFIKDNGRMHDVFYSKLMHRKIIDFKPIKTRMQIDYISAHIKESPFMVGLLNCIVNYGYISDDCQPVKPGDLINRNDLSIAIFKHWQLLDSGRENIKDIRDLRDIHNFKITHNLTAYENESHALKVGFMSTFSDPRTKTKSKINSSIGTTNTFKYKSMKELIRFASSAIMGDSKDDMVNHFVRKYELKDQWEWDGKTKPDIENLGFINIYDTVDIDFLDNKEDQEESW